MAEGSQERMENRDNEVGTAACPSSVSPKVSNGPLISDQSEVIVTGKGPSPSSNRDSYWFAQSHGGESLTEQQQVQQNRVGSVDSDEHSPGSGWSAAVREREERARLLRERQIEERARKLEELRSSTVQAQRFREQQEDERRRRIEEIRTRDMERRNQVEERKKHIWEVEKDRRDGILRKSQERDARVEAVRNAHRSSIGFAFGSCTPRLLELDPPSVFGGRRSTSQSNVALSAVPASRAIDIDLGERSTRAAYRHSVHELFGWGDGEQREQRPEEPLTVKEDSERNGPLVVGPSIPPYCTLPRKGLRYESALTGSGVLVGEDPMTRSTSAIMGVAARRGRRRTDLIPTTPTTYREGGSGTAAFGGNSSQGGSVGGQRMGSPGRAYSMTRLDQLALPRRSHTLEAVHESHHGHNLSKTKSMSHLAYRKAGKGGGAEARSSSSTPSMRRTNASKSMSQLCSRPPSSSSSSSPEFSGSAASYCSANRSQSKSLLRPFLAPSLTPRPTRTSLLRKDAQDPGGNNKGMSASERSRMLSKSMVHLARRTEGNDDTFRAAHTSASSSSPSRPHSSLSQQSISSHNGSAINLRARSTPRKPRPVSVAGSTADNWSSGNQRQSRSIEKKPPLVSKPPRAKSAGPTQPAESLSTRSSPPLPPKPAAAPRKPTAAPTPRKIVPATPPAAVNEKPKPAAKPARKTPSKPAQKEPDAPEKSTTREERKVTSSKVETELVNIKKDGVVEVVVETTNESFVSDTVQLDATFSVEEERAVETRTTSNQGGGVVVVVDDSSTTVVSNGGDLTEELLEDIVQPPDLVRVESVTETVESETMVVSVSGQSAENVTTKQRITTEEEAKALLAERRRIAREQAEKEAELERLRQEQLQREEEERLKREEEAQRLWEEEQERQSKLEKERLQRAIEEQQQREEEERQRRNEELQLKLKKEEAEAKAREEAEKLRKETEEKLKKEEEERAERRKRVKAIMSRTQKGTSTPPVTTPNKSIEPAVEIAEKMASKEEQHDVGDDIGTGEGKIAADMRDKERVISTPVMNFTGENGAHTNGFAHHEHYNLIMENQSSGEKSDDLAEFDPLISSEVSLQHSAHQQLADLDSNMRTDESASTKAATISNVSILNNEDNVNSNVTSNGQSVMGLHDNFSKQQESGVVAAAEPFFI